jgi:hypothetical protein
VSPILVRPVREQLEHDRIIRLLVPKYKRRFQVFINPGSEMNQAVGEGPDAFYPDAVMMPPGRGRKVVGVVEVETQESVNAMEAMAQWAVYGRLPIEFFLFVPAGSVEVARRLCLDNHIGVTELWTYHAVGDQVRFTVVHKAPVEAKIATARAAAQAAAAERRETERLAEAAKRAAARHAAARKRPAKASKAAKPAKAKTAPARKAAKPAKTVKKAAARKR